MPPFPTHPHDWALWLFKTLEQLEHVGSHWQGVLPARFDFDEVVGALHDRLKGLTDPGRRTIEFHPEAVAVYESMADLVEGGRRRGAPKLFTVRELDYTHGRTAEIPDAVVNYLSAVRLWSLFDGVADHGTGQGQALFFIKTFVSKVELRCEYGVGDLSPIAGLDEFAKNYFESEHHQDQKRNIVRDALLETFKGKLVVRLSELLPKFSEFADRVRSAYTLYTADFSFEKLRSEVDKQNLEDMLRLNKTLSDIQNQLLALPASLLLVGASVKPKNFAVNVSILTGVIAFVWIMRSLIRNQLSSVEAIDGEVQLREAKIRGQRAEISATLLPRFDQLRARIKNQNAVLIGIQRAMWVVLAVTTVVVTNEQWPAMIESIVQTFETHGLRLIGYLTEWAGDIVNRVRAMRPL
jgi:hypothetical protein